MFSDALSNGTVHSKYDCEYGYSTFERRCKSSRTVGTPHSKLGASNQGPVGPQYSEGLRNRVYFSTSAGRKATPSTGQSGSTAACESRNLEAMRKRGGDGARNSAGGRFLLHPISGAKERRRPETGDQPKKSKLLYRRSTLPRWKESIP